MQAGLRRKTQPVRIHQDLRVAKPEYPGHHAQAFLRGDGVDIRTPSGHARLLIRAAEILGGEHELQGFLQASEGELQRWMEGRSRLPVELFLKLTDLLVEHNLDWVSQARLRQDRLREQWLALKKSRQLVETSHATLAQSRDAKHPAIVLRSARLRGEDTDGAPGIEHRLFDPRFVPADRAQLLETALDATLTVAGTDLGNVQLIDADGNLRIEAHRGFAKPFLEFFAVVSQPECACGVALSLGQQVFIPDVQRSYLFAGTEEGRVLESAGCAAVTSSPLVHVTGMVMGMISTHYRKPCGEHQAALPSLELIAKRAASWLEPVPIPPPARPGPETARR